MPYFAKFPIKSSWENLGIGIGMGLLFVKVRLSDDLFEGAVLMFFKGSVNMKRVTKENTWTSILAILLTNRIIEMSNLSKFRMKGRMIIVRSLYFSLA